MTADRVGGISGLGQRVQNDLVQAIGVAAVAGMHHQFRNGDCRAAALGAVFAESLGLGADAAVKLDVRTEHAVAVQDIAGADRLAEMGETFVPSYYPHNFKSVKISSPQRLPSSHRRFPSCRLVRFFRSP